MKICSTPKRVHCRGENLKPIYDISLPVYPGMPVYKNKPEKQPEFQVVSDFATGSAHETRVHLDVHTGTHVDAPLHMLPDGATTESLTLERLVRTCKVIDLTHVEGAITAQHLLECGDISRGDFLLLKTRNSNDTVFNPEFVYLAEDGARVLADAGVVGVGIDALGIERNQPGHPTHKALFAEGVVIVEGLNLSQVPAGAYLLIAAPLKLIGLDAAPARVLLMDLA